MKKILQVLQKKTIFPPPIWMMRQAGRYLPEYKTIRTQTNDFLKLCTTPSLAAEITLQPIQRFSLDAAILFSDILIIPHALGQKVSFKEGYGPILSSLNPKDIKNIHLRKVKALDYLSFTYESLRLIKKELNSKTALIGFCGAPWTIATYMIAGRSIPDQAPARLFFYRYPKIMQRLLFHLADVSAQYLIEQINAGAEIIQIFDSWANGLDEKAFELLCITPIRHIIKQVRKIHKNTPIISFPRGAGFFFKDYAQKTGVSALGFDCSVPLKVIKNLQNDIPVQGNLDPFRLATGGKMLTQGIDAILSKLGRNPLIFNLGHGVLPTTKIKHVETMIEYIRSKDKNE